MKRLFALAFCVLALGFVTVPTSKAQGFSFSIGNGGYCYPHSYGYGGYNGYRGGYGGGCYDPYYSGYSQQSYYSAWPVYYYNSGNPYGYRRSYYRRGHRYVYRGGYRSSRSHHHPDWQD